MDIPWRAATRRYVSFQTNVEARWDADGAGVFYPQISPYDAWNHLVLNTTSESGAPWGGAFALVSTASERTRDVAIRALTDAGLPAAAVNVDALGTDDVTFWTGDWRDDLPDTF